MPLNKHPSAKTFTLPETFYFETPWHGRPESIPQLEVAYQAWGNPAHKAILVCHPLTSNTNCTNDDPQSQSDPSTTATEFPSSIRSTKPWWPEMVGPNKPIDTNRFYVICPNVIGGCGGSSGPASINPKTNKPYARSFPVVTIGDTVRAHYLLLKWLGIERLHAVIGCSLGGFQALEWGISYLDLVEKLIIIASSSYSTQFHIMTNRAQIEAIQRDALYQEGNYSPDREPISGLMVARQIGYTTFISPQMMERKFAKHQSSTTTSSNSDPFLFRLHQAENYLNHVSASFTQDFDANSMIYLLQTWSHFDIAAKYGSLSEALAPSRLRLLTICATGDNLFAPFLSQFIQRAALRAHLDAKLVTINELYGHDFFLLPKIIKHKLAPVIENFMNN